MVYKNRHQLSRIYTDVEFEKEFSNLFALKMFFEKSIFEADYKSNYEFESAIALTPIGNEMAAEIQNKFKDISIAEINQALFLKFFHQSLLIDVKNTNQQVIRNILNNEILNKNIRHPWIYELILYDRFFEMFENGMEKLSNEQTMRLLEGTPQGVFQIRDLVVGPFGVLTSSCFRILPPLLNCPLWNCSDPSCDAMHPTYLSSGNILVLRVRDFIGKHLEEAEGIESEWHRFFQNFAGEPDFHDDMHLANFPWVLINGFSEKEVRIILSRLIEDHSEIIRELFPSDKRFKRIFFGSGDNISMNLNKPQAIQIILLMPDEFIIECIESLIDDEIIKIPTTEIRNSRISTNVGQGAFKPLCDISRLGLRSYPHDTKFAILRLKRLIKSLYTEKDELKDLEYKLRFVKGKEIYEKLENYLYTENPKKIVRDFVIPSPDNLEKTFKLMRYGRFCAPSTEEEENHLIDKILWKLGFDIYLYTPQHTLFWNRLKKFSEVSRNYSTDNESNREIIRSAGVNFFVSLEEILNLSLTFMTWALLSDHYSMTKFKFNFSEAQNFVASCLNEKSIGSNPRLTFDGNGKNTLYPLIQGFTLLSELCEEITKDAESRLKPKHELPYFHGKMDIQSFPFIHKELILDLSENDQNQIIEFLRKMTVELERVNISKIRNQIDHKRDDFPNKEEIEFSIGSVDSIIREAENLGVIPLIYTYVSSKSDKYERKLIEYKNYKGISLNITKPSQYGLSKIPDEPRPLIIVPCMHIGESIELVRFNYQESSEYVEMWNNYPKRKIILNSEEMKENEQLISS